MTETKPQSRQERENAAWAEWIKAHEELVRFSEKSRERRADVQ